MTTMALAMNPIDSFFWCLEVGLASFSVALSYVLGDVDLVELEENVLEVLEEDPSADITQIRAMFWWKHEWIEQVLNRYERRRDFFDEYLG